MADPANVEPSESSQIVERLRDVRLERGLSQNELAAEMGISRDQLASSETGRTRLRFNPAWKACRALDVNPSWLASGRGDKSPFVFYGFEPGERASITEQTSFIDGYGLISKRYAVEWDIGANNASTGRGLAINSAFSEQAILDSLSPSTISSAEMSRWNVLRKKLDKLVAAYGAKSQIAKTLKVTRQAVDQWVNGKSAPTAETTLRLLEWVTAEEAKQKSAPEVRKHDRRKRPERKITKNEKPDSDRKKK